MDASKVLSLLEQLDEEIDDLEELLTPLVATALSDTASKLPLLDKAKLYVLVTYAIESIIFCESHIMYASYDNSYI
jgi:exosome complex protein LRP1